MEFNYITGISAILITGMFQSTLAAAEMDFATAEAITKAQAAQTNTETPLLEIPASAQSRAIDLTAQNHINQRKVAVGLVTLPSQKPATSKDFSALLQPSSFKPYSTELKKCFLTSATTEQKESITKWIFVAYSSNPLLNQMVSISSKEREQINKSFADTYTTLLTQTCKNQTIDAFKYEGTSARTTAFFALGEIGGRELVSNPIVLQNMKDFTKYLDHMKFDNQSDSNAVASK
ncbi:MAG: hypothetical protein KGO49_09095 [Gammaproteobacteria bacterium]|nr:hypothetical protein [Gammaproteobacteria bacterium]